ncbi:MAG TPA: diheme cytochrome c [Casimicrobiaceae bacterium]|nr:diheme cytochrome c [Casimicrobiaceae bacterium]
MNARSQATSRVRGRVGAAVVCAAVAGLLASPGAIASGPKRSAATNAAWKSECGSCHVAYPPSLLPAASWRAIMASLDRHFGTDATIDAPTAAAIEEFLVASAGRDRSRSPTTKPVLRITETRWFLHEHDDVAPATLRSPAVKSAANCGACHLNADSGRFSEREIRVPPSKP